MTAAKSVIVERDLAHPPEKIWRALTQPALLAEWLMPADIAATPGHAFRFHQEWGTVDCTVLRAEPFHTFSYTWNGMGLTTAVTWTLTPLANGTRLRMEQQGFTTAQGRAYGGARAGWPQFFDNLEHLLGRPTQAR